MWSVVRAPEFWAGIWVGAGIVATVAVVVIVAITLAFRRRHVDIINKADSVVDAAAQVVAMYREQWTLEAAHEQAHNDNGE